MFLRKKKQPKPRTEQKESGFVCCGHINLVQNIQSHLRWGTRLVCLHEKGAELAFIKYPRAYFFLPLH